MQNRMILPLTNTARRFGYITWPKAQDSQVEEFFGDVDDVQLQVADEIDKRCHIDRKRRRIYVSYVYTRQLGPRVNTIVLTRGAADKLNVVFEQRD